VSSCVASSGAPSDSEGEGEITSSEDMKEGVIEEERAERDNVSVCNESVASLAEGEVLDSIISHPGVPAALVQAAQNLSVASLDGEFSLDGEYEEVDLETQFSQILNEAKVYEKRMKDKKTSKKKVKSTSRR
jgi:hypothetical protein